MKNLGKRYIGLELSNATMRSEDLIQSFMHFLENVAKECGIQEEVKAIQNDVAKLETVDESEYGTYYTDESQEEASWILNESIWDLLNDIAPDFCYFGSHPGDGACYGFWSDEESLKDAILIRLGDLMEDSNLDEIQNTMNWASDLLNSHGL